MTQTLMLVNRDELKELFLDFMNDEQQDRPLDVKGAADKLKFSTKKITKMAEQGELPGRKLGSQWRFSDRGLDRWLENREAY